MGFFVKNAMDLWIYVLDDLIDFGLNDNDDFDYYDYHEYHEYHDYLHPPRFRSPSGQNGQVTRNAGGEVSCFAKKNFFVVF